MANCRNMTWHEDTRSELHELSATHCIISIPAYNIKGDLIKPEAYRQTLEDATIEICHNEQSREGGHKSGTAGVFVAGSKS